MGSTFLNYMHGFRQDSDIRSAGSACGAWPDAEFHRSSQECPRRCKNSREEWHRRGSASDCGAPGRRSACRSKKSRTSPGFGARFSWRLNRKPSTSSPAPRMCGDFCGRMPRISVFHNRSSSSCTRVRALARRQERSCTGNLPLRCESHPRSGCPRRGGCLSAWPSWEGWASWPSASSSMGRSASLRRLLRPLRDRRSHPPRSLLVRLVRRNRRYRHLALLRSPHAPRHRNRLLPRLRFRPRAARP
jgi:hypothetical protein